MYFFFLQFTSLTQHFGGGELQWQQDFFPRRRLLHFCSISRKSQLGDLGALRKARQGRGTCFLFFLCCWCSFLLSTLCFENCWQCHGRHQILFVYSLVITCFPFVLSFWPHQQGWPRSSLYIAKKYEELKETHKNWPDRYSSMFYLWLTWLCHYDAPTLLSYTKKTYECNKVRLFLSFPFPCIVFIM